MNFDCFHFQCGVLTEKGGKDEVKNVTYQVEVGETWMTHKYLEHFVHLASYVDA